jgi:hypothetical protein
VLRDLWNRLMRRENDAAVKRETELEKMSPAERRFEKESVEDHQADSFVGEHLGGINPDRLLDDDEPPRD